MRLIVVSGLSGSGKSVALDMLEDLDFYCVDNIPAGLLPGFIAYTVRTSEPAYRNTAVGVDARNRPEDLADVPRLVAELRRSGYEELLSSGIVLTGGSSVMLGMVELGEEVFHMPVRVGAPQYSGGLADVVCHPRYATAMGLVMEGHAQRRRGMLARETRSVKQVFGRMKAWFEKNF